MPPHALIFFGGWDGHEPDKVAALLASLLRDDGFSVEVHDSLDVLDDASHVRELSLIVPVWTMGKISDEQVKNVCSAVADLGVGVAGCHGGMCDAFRESTDWHFLTGGQWVAHPGDDGTRYTVRVTDHSHPITEGISDYEVSTEQYYLHVDPGVKVLARTTFPVAGGPHLPNGTVEMPVIWTKRYGRGRVYYNALGHHADVLEAEPTRTLIRRGFRWASRSS